MSKSQQTSRAPYRESQATGLVQQRKAQVLQFIREHEHEGGVSQGNVGLHFRHSSSSYG